MAPKPKKRVIVKKKQDAVRVTTQGVLLTGVKKEVPELCPHCGAAKKGPHRLGVVYECGVLFPVK